MWYHSSDHISLFSVTWEFEDIVYFMSVMGKFSSSGRGRHIDGGKWLTLLPGKNPGTHSLIGGWVGPRDRLDVLEKRKISCPFGHSNP